MATSKVPIRLDSTNAKDFLERFDTILFDCDGVLWAVDQFTKFEGVADTINKLRDLGKGLYFVSNNPTYTVKTYAEKFSRMAGFEGRESEVVGISHATAVYLRDVAKVQGKVYVLGTPSVAEELQEAGLEAVGVGRSPEPLVEDITKELPKLLRMEMDEDVGAVLVAMDTTFDYNKWFKAVNYLRDPNCVFVATNAEPIMAMGVKGLRKNLPITGAIVAAVEAGSGRKATVIGKPSPNFLTCLKADHPDVQPARTVIIGDYLDSDIAFGNNCDIASVLVCTGADDEEILEKRRASDSNTPVPTYILSSVADLAKWI